MKVRVNSFARAMTLYWVPLVHCGYTWFSHLETDGANTMLTICLGRLVPMRKKAQLVFSAN